LHYLKYATIDEFFCKGLRYVSIKVAQGDLQKFITWPKKSGKGRQNGTKHVSIRVFPPGN